MSISSPIFRHNTLRLHSLLEPLVDSHEICGLADPEIQGHTERILALQKEERQACSKLGSIIAAIGAELIAVKETLDKLPAKTAWLRWLKDHVHYSADTAENYMRVARFAKKIVNAYEFFDLDPSVLYRVAARPGSGCLPFNIPL